MKGWTLGPAWKKRLKLIRNWPIVLKESCRFRQFKATKMNTNVEMAISVHLTRKLRNTFKKATTPKYEAVLSLDSHNYFKATAKTKLTIQSILIFFFVSQT